MSALDDADLAQRERDIWGQPPDDPEIAFITTQTRLIREQSQVVSRQAKDIRALTAALRKMVEAACQAPMSDGEAEGWYGYVPEFIAEEALDVLKAHGLRLPQNQEDGE